MQAQAPDPPPPVAVDPNLATEQASAQATLISSMQNQAQGDTASLMARYGTRLALMASPAQGPMASPAQGAPPAGRF
jgi:hypothetical protein